MNYHISKIPQTHPSNPLSWRLKYQPRKIHILWLCLESYGSMYDRKATKEGWEHKPIHYRKHISLAEPVWYAFPDSKDIRRKEARKTGYNCGGLRYTHDTKIQRNDVSYGWILNHACFATSSGWIKAKKSMNKTIRRKAYTIRHTPFVRSYQRAVNLFWHADLKNAQISELIQY